MERDIWLSADHIARCENVVTDFKSRNFKKNTEWQLSPAVLTKVTTAFFWPECDLFASRLNTQVSRFASWYPKPGSWVVNAFSILWWDINKFYAFPPFSLIGRSLAKVRQEEATGIMIVPLCSIQAWFLLMFAASCCSSTVHTSSQRATSVTGTEKSGAPTLQAAGPFSNTYFGQTIGQYTLPASTVYVISHSWRGGTRSQYDSAIKGWRRYCIVGKINPTCPSIEEILAYLTCMRMVCNTIPLHLQIVHWPMYWLCQGYLAFLHTHWYWDSWRVFIISILQTPDTLWYGTPSWLLTTYGLSPIITFSLNCCFIKRSCSWHCLLNVWVLFTILELTRSKVGIGQLFLMWLPSWSRIKPHGRRSLLYFMHIHMMNTYALPPLSNSTGWLVMHWCLPRRRPFFHQMGNRIMLLQRTPWHDGLKIPCFSVGWILLYPHSCRSASSSTAKAPGVQLHKITYRPVGHGIDLLQILPAPDCLEWYHH